MKRFPIVKVTKEQVQPTIVALGSNNYPVYRDFDVVDRELVPPEIRKELEINTVVHHEVLAVMSQEDLKRMVYDRLVHELAEELMQYVEITENKDYEYNCARYRATIVIEDLNMLEETNEEI